MKLAFKASLFSALVGTFLLVSILFFPLGFLALELSVIVFPVVFFSALLLTIPLIQLHGKIKEPFYLLVFLMVGILSGMVIINLVFQKATVFPANFFAYGAMGAVCSFSAWFYLRQWGAMSDSKNA